MTKDEIKKMVNTCNSYYSCALCPYNPEDISRFIGDRWKGGCPDYDRKLVYAMGKGYGNVSEYEAEIERLTEKLKQVLLAVDTVKEMNTMRNIDEQRKRAVQDFAEKLWNKIKDNGIDYKIGLRALGEEIDELLKEYEDDTL